LYDSDSELSKDNELSFEKEGSVYILVQQQKDNNYTLILKDEQNNEQIKIEMQSIFDKLLIDDNVQKEFISVDEATIIEENQQVKLKFIVESMNVYDNQYNADLFLFIKIK